MKWPEKIGEQVIATRSRRQLLERQYRHPVTDEVGSFAMSHVAESIPVILFPLTADHKVLAVWQFRFGADAPIIEIPGGDAKRGQSTKEAVLVELREETGYGDPEMIIPLPCEGIFFEPVSFTGSYTPYLVTGCKKIGLPEFEKWEIAEVMTFSLEEWVEMLGSGQIRDDKNYAITCLALRYLKRQLGWDVPSLW